MSLITIEHLRKEYQGVTPLEDVNASINKGDVIAIIGPSGTGKSTLLRCLNQLEMPTAGTVTVNGQVITDPSCDITLVRREMGMVFQSFNLFQNLNIIDNVCVAPIQLLKMDREEAHAKGLALLERVGLADKAQSFPEELSGGQQQRVAIARAVAMDPQILLLDEPTSALDPTMVGEVLSVIRGLANEGMTMMIVTHEMHFARNVSNRVFYMDEGGIYEEGTPEQIFERPQREKTRAFIQRLKTLDLLVEDIHGDYVSMLSKLGKYGANVLIPAGIQHRMMLACEELVIQTILPAARRGDTALPLTVHIEYSEAQGSVQMSFAWEGKSFDPLTAGEELSMVLVSNMASSAEYRYTDRNELEVTIN